MTKAIETILRRRMDPTGEKLEAAETRHDLLQHVVEQGKRPDNDQPLTSLEIIDHMSEVLIGGSETTSTQIGTLFLELARNPTVRAKLLDSLPTVSIFDEGVVSAKSVRVEKDRYEYLEACIKENLRLHPIASELGRRTGADQMEIGGYSLPPYTVVCASYRAVHRSEQYWPQALRFWPERVSVSPCLLSALINTIDLDKNSQSVVKKCSSMDARISYNRFSRRMLISCSYSGYRKTKGGMRRQQSKLFHPRL